MKTNFGNHMAIWQALYYVMDTARYNLKEYATDYQEEM